MFVLRKNRIPGRFLKFQINSFYGNRGGLQYIGLPASNKPKPGFQGKYKY